ncbi:Cuticle protein LPCP-23 [Dufourea novaeangliae]|uniref:Cuticle protein LPCP-23 n=1 Tax=Dufourea novaeangliae TaxID=178035 RepID=A0A154P7Y8_DUFNO|nr:Cuticle protein LPCP-23 [Dufourea novaeangliae]
MRNTSETKRPSIPDTWGSENASPTRSYVLIDDDESIVFQPKQLSKHNVSLCCSKDFSPTEEYFQMMERLIKSKSLPRHETLILKNLYVKYKSIINHGSTTGINRASRDPSADQKAFYLKKQQPSSSKDSETLSLKSRDSNEMHQRHRSREKIDQVDQREMELASVEDFSFDHFCDPDMFIIDNVFSDFSLQNANQQSILQRNISTWAKTRKTQTSRIATISGNRQSVGTNVVNQPNQNVEQVTEAPRQSPLRKFVAFAACLAVARASGPAAYDIAAASGDLGSIGFSQESTQKGYGGQNVISSYSRAEDSAHSSVRVSSHSVSNDALLNYNLHHAPIVKTAIAGPAYITPTATPLIAKTYGAQYSYAAAAPLIAKTYTAPYSYAAAAPLIKTYAAPAAPLYAKAYAAAPISPLLTKTIAAPAPLLTKTYAAPATPLLTNYEYAAHAPVITKSYEYAAHAPVIAKSALLAPAQGYAAPIFAKSGPIYDYAPQSHFISKTLEPASPLVHTVFNGLGTSYAW